jgi:imidazolonepropionase-like amidohydrolase
MRKLFIFLAVMCFAAPGAAAQQTKPAGKTYALKAARLFDGNSDALVKPGIVVVTDGKIVAAGASATVPPGAEVIDLGDATCFQASSTRIPT